MRQKWNFLDFSCRFFILILLHWILKFPWKSKIFAPGFECRVRMNRNRGASKIFMEGKRRARSCAKNFNFLNRDYTFRLRFAEFRCKYPPFQDEGRKFSVTLPRYMKQMNLLLFINNKIEKTLFRMLESCWYFLLFELSSWRLPIGFFMGLLFLGLVQWWVFDLPPARFTGMGDWTSKRPSDPFPSEFSKVFTIIILTSKIKIF